MMKRTMLLAAVLAVVVSGASRAAEKFTADKATGSVTGVVTLAGDAPKVLKVDVSGDAKCLAMHGAANPLFKEEVVVNDGKLANVVVYVKKGQEKFSYDV